MKQELRKHPAFGVIKDITKQGHALFVYGGFVRDALAGRIPGDLDILVDMREEEVYDYFDSGEWFVLDLRDFGVPTKTFRVINSDFYIDISLLEKKLEDVLKNLDFTVDAIAYDPVMDRIIDPLRGLQDLKKSLLKTPISPAKSFKKDPSRVFRGLRISAKLDLRIHPAVREAMHTIKTKDFKKVDKRIEHEFFKAARDPVVLEKFLLLVKKHGLLNISREIVPPTKLLERINTKETRKVLIENYWKL